jgi:hypothetical protein
MRVFFHTKGCYEGRENCLSGFGFFFKGEYLFLQIVSVCFGQYKRLLGKFYFAKIDHVVPSINQEVDLDASVLEHNIEVTIQ